MLDPNQYKCKLCRTIFVPRKTGGSPKKFCTKKCKNEFESYCNQFSKKLIDNNHITVEELINLEIR
jgi:hypothetical protein